VHRPPNSAVDDRVGPAAPPPSLFCRLKPRVGCPSPQEEKLCLRRHWCSVRHVVHPWFVAVDTRVHPRTRGLTVRHGGPCVSEDGVDRRCE
jgi:hypothetical protein